MAWMRQAIKLSGSPVSGLTVHRSSKFRQPFSRPPPRVITVCSIPTPKTILMPPNGKCSDYPGTRSRACDRAPYFPADRGYPPCSGVHGEIVWLASRPRRATSLKLRGRRWEGEAPGGFARVEMAISRGRASLGEGWFDQISEPARRLGWYASSSLLLFLRGVLRT